MITQRDVGEAQRERVLAALDSGAWCTVAAVAEGAALGAHRAREVLDRLYTRRELDRRRSPQDRRAHTLEYRLAEHRIKIGRSLVPAGAALLERHAYSCSCGDAGELGSRVEAATAAVTHQRSAPSRG